VADSPERVSGSGGDGEQKQKEGFMKENIRWVTWAAALLALLGVAADAYAAPLPAPSVNVSVTNLAEYTGTVVQDTGPIIYSFGTNVGVLREWVVSNGTGALCPTCLAFVYQFHVTTGDVGRISASSYDGFTVDVSQVAASVSLPGSLPGIFGASNADRDASGSTIDFDFTSPVTAGFNSFVLIANTNSSASQAGIMFLTSSTGADSANVAGFVPGQATVPEPATVLLVGSGVLALGVWRRRSQHLK
jgi:hypothetical protein